MKLCTIKSSALVGAVLVVACGGASTLSHEESSGEQKALLTGGESALGVVPAGLPKRLLVGLFENSGGTWMKSSGVPWNARYRYLTRGWADNWGWGSHDGSYALNYMKECDAQGTVPVVQYYIMNDEPGGGEDQFYLKTQNAQTMADYFADFRLLLQRTKEFNKPVLILVEGDGFGYMEQQTGNNPNAYSAIAASGLPELAALPNSAAGWGLSFLQLRKSVGATNAVLGQHISSWASGLDLMTVSVTAALQPEIDKVYGFLSPLGLAPNVTGSTYDVLVGDPLDRDSDFYRITYGRDTWWDASDTASISSKSFNRYAEWLRLWNQKSSKRWVVWQIPLGNSNHLNVKNAGGARQGYKDNRPEYFFGPSRDAHLQKWANAGAIALLFGAGVGGQSSFGNDIYTDGQSFIKSRAGAFLSAGGLSLTGTSPPPPPPTADAGTPTADAGAPKADAGTPRLDSGAVPPTGDTAQYNFESSAQGWTGAGAPIVSALSSTIRAFAGTRSLAVNFAGAAATSDVFVTSPGVSAGKTISFNVFCPAGSAVTAIQPFAVEGAAGGWHWTGNWKPMSSLTAGAWNTINVALPTNATALYALGVEFTTNASWTGACFVDSVRW